MKLKTQFVIITTVFGVILLAASVSVIITYQCIKETRKQVELAGTIQQDAYELGYLSNDYLTYGGSQQAGRWESKFASLSGKVSRLNVDSPRREGADQLYQVVSGSFKNHI